LSLCAEYFDSKTFPANKGQVQEKNREMDLTSVLTSRFIFDYSDSVQLWMGTRQETKYRGFYQKIGITVLSCVKGCMRQMFFGCPDFGGTAQQWHFRHHAAFYF